MLKVGDIVIASWPKTQFEEGILAEIKVIHEDGFHVKYLSSLKKNPLIKHGFWVENMLTLFVDPNDIMKELCSK